MPVAMADCDRLVDVFTVLIDNSLTFSNPSRAAVIKIGCRANAEALEIQVEDNGIGIPEDMRERVFGIFERLHPENEASGTGIGLAVVRKIVDSAGGKVWIDGVPVGGTRVCITIPNRIEP
jgi:signal transduction histidine kinase